MFLDVFYQCRRVFTLFWSMERLGYGRRFGLSKLRVRLLLGANMQCQLYQEYKDRQRSDSRRIKQRRVRETTFVVSSEYVTCV